MINPKALDIKSLPWLPLEEKAAFPKKPAIYFAIDSQETVQYIGRTVNVRHRWGSHHKYDALSEIGNVKIAYLFIDTVELLPEIEAALIEWFDPPLNNSLSSFTNTDEKLVAVKAFVPESTRNAFKAACAKKGITMSDTLSKFIETFIDEEQQEKTSSKKKGKDAA